MQNSEKSGGISVGTVVFPDFLRLRPCTDMLIIRLTALPIYPSAALSSVDDATTSPPSSALQTVKIFSIVSLKKRASALVAVSYMAEVSILATLRR